MLVFCVGVICCYVKRRAGRVNRNIRNEEIEMTEFRRVVDPTPALVPEIVGDMMIL